MLSIAFFQAPTESHAFTVSIEAAPKILNIANSGATETIRTGISYDSVNSTSVSVFLVSDDPYDIDMPLYWYKTEADAQGNFVSKFYMYDLKSDILSYTSS